MRYRILLFTAVLILTAGCCAVAETPDISIAAPQEWTWESEGYNTFDGLINLSAFIGKEITLTVSTDLEYGRDEDESMPVFTDLNGKRIKMSKQKNSVTLTPDEETSVTAFSGRITLPKGNSVRKITFRFSAADADGREMKSWSFVFGDAKDRDSTNFRIPVDMTLVTICLSAAAALAWTCVLIRNRKQNRKRIQENESYADL